MSKRLLFFLVSASYAWSASPIFKEAKVVERKVLDVGYSAHCTVIDWDCDGKKDLIVGDLNGYIWFYKNIGRDDAPSYGKGEKIETDAGPIKIDDGYASPHPCDWDESSHWDLLIGGGNGEVWIARSINKKEEGKPPIFSSIERVRAGDGAIDVGDNASPFFFDVDEDNLSDLLVGDRHGRIWFFRNEGREDLPIFSSGVLTLVGSITLDVGQFAKPVMVDWDDDGRKDLIVGDKFGNVSVFLAGTQTVGTEAFVPKFLERERVKVANRDIDVGMFASPFVCDWNNDGGYDLIVGSGDGELHLFLNTNSHPAEPPLFNTSQKIDGDPEPLKVGKHSKPYVVDWNNDGRKDLIVGEEFGKVALFLNSGTDQEPLFTDSFWFQKTVGTQTSDLSVKYDASPSVCDWNNDGRKDLVVGNRYGHIMIFISSNTDKAPIFSEGTFATTADGPIDVGADAAPFVCDWDNDGAKDIIVGNSFGEIWFFRNTGSDESPQFSGRTRILCNGANINVGNNCVPVVFDWNRDYKKDLLVGVKGGELWLFINTGEDSSPVFTAKVKVRLQDGADIKRGDGDSAPAVCDWDGNNSDDLVVGGKNGEIHLYLSVLSNAPPMVTINTPKETESGNVNILYTLTDEDSDTCYITPEYSKDGGITWHRAMSAEGGDGISGLSSSPNGLSHIFVWDSLADLGSTEASVIFRITPHDGTEEGAGVTTSAFSVNNITETEFDIVQIAGRNIDVGAYSTPCVYDWNNDGRKDLLVGDQYGYITLFLNSGTDENPIFTTSSKLQARKDTSTTTMVDLKATSFSVPSVVDWNNDGMKDLLVGDGPGFVLGFENIGSDRTPILQKGVRIQAGSDLDVGNRAVVRVYDWDMDGKKDLLVGDEYGYVRIYLNYGADEAPKFSTSTKLLVGTNSLLNVGYNAAPAVVDWNNNGKRDLIVGNRDGYIWLFLNYGDNSAPIFDKGTKIKIRGKDVKVDGFAVPYVVDWDEDGRSDLLIGNQKGTVYILLVTEERLNNPPSCSIEPIDGAEGTVTICYTLIDPDGDTCSILPEYSLDGKIWKEAEGVDKENLYASSVGVLHRFYWNSIADLPNTKREVYFRITPSDRLISGSISEVSFLLDNLNRPPSVENIKIYGDSGIVKIAFDLEDKDGDTVNIVLKYRIEDGTWTEATQLGPVSMKPGRRTIFWASGIDLPQRDAVCAIKITPSDEQGEGVSATATVHIKNQRVSQREIKESDEGKEIEFSPTRLIVKRVSYEMVVTVEEVDEGSLPICERAIPKLSGTVRRIAVVEKENPEKEVAVIDATLMIPYRDGFSEDIEREFAIFELSGSLWREIESSVDLDKNLVKADITSPGTFRIALGSAKRLDVKLFPNPCKAPVRTVTFLGLPEGARVRIYTLRGELIDEVDGATWNTKNSAGSYVASGIYLWLAEHNGEHQKGILVIIR